MAVLTPTTTEVQQVADFMIYIFIGLAVLVLVIYILIRFYRKATYKYTVDVYEKVGDSTIQREERAREIKHEGSYMFHYDKLNVLSPVIDPKYHRLKTSLLFGFFKKTSLHFSVFKVGKSLFPLAVKNNPGLIPINLDQFNYMQTRIEANQKKYIRINEWKQLLPYIALGTVVIMFILGMMFWGKHVEAISNNIISSSVKVAEMTLQNSGAGQVIQPI